MSRPAVAAACVALLAVTAGCGGAFGGQGPPTREPYEVEPTATRTPAPTPTPTSAPAAAPGASDPRASAAFRRAVANHTEALHRTGNFTVRWSRRSGQVVDGRDPEPFVTVAAVDLDAGRYAVGEPADDGDGSTLVVEAYEDATGVYRRIDGTFRDVTGRDGFPPEQFVRQRVERTPNRAARFPLERNGTATVDGEEMARFTVDDPAAVRNAYTDLRIVTAVSATVLVDDRGIVRRFSYAVRGRTFAGETVVDGETVAITDVGATAVRRPDALADTTEAGEGGPPEVTGR